MKIRPVQGGFLVAGAVLAALLLLTFRRVPRPKSHVRPMTMPPGAPADAGKPTTLLSVFDYTESAAGRPRFRIHADRTVGFAQGAGLPSTWYGLEKVALTLYSERQPPITVTSDRADFDPRTNAAHLAGNVVLSEPAGTIVRTARLSFDPAADAVKIPEPIDFQRGGMTGHASSGLYDLSSRELTLAGPVSARGSPGPGVPFSSLDARTAVYRQASAEVEFAGDVRGEGGGNTLASEALTLHLTPDDHIESAVAAGEVSGVLAGSGDPPSRDPYSGDRARLGFDGAGKLSRAELVGSPGAPATIVEPPRGSEGARRVAAPKLSLALAGGKLASARGEEGVRVEAPGTDASGASFLQTVDADRADASYGPDGLLSSVTFTGRVRGSSPQGQGSAPRAVYSPGRHRVVLSADDRDDAVLASPRGRVLARTVEIDTENSVVTATGQARAFFRGDGTPAATPHFLSDRKQPTRGRARRIVLDDRRRTALLSGEAALWQQENALFADEIFLNDSERSATAKGSVRVTAVTAQGEGPAAKHRPSEEKEKAGQVTAASDRMRYEEGRRVATFEEKVRLTRGAARAAGDRAEVHFNDADRVDRLALDGHVTFEDPPTGRRGEGDHAVDEPLEGTTVLSGDPAVARDGQGNRITGAILTFHKESGSVEAKAKEGQRIETIYQTHGT